MPSKVSLLFFLILFVVAGCDWGEQGRLNVGKREDLLKHVNKARGERRECGTRTLEAAPALTWNDKLAEAALRHARDVATSGKEGHVGSDGSGPSSRVLDEGYVYDTVGEILATGSSSVDEVMEGFLNSPGHCAVLMSQQYTETGAAMAGGRVWTIVFASPRID